MSCPCAFSLLKSVSFVVSSICSLVSMFTLFFLVFLRRRRTKYVYVPGLGGFRCLSTTPAVRQWTSCDNELNSVKPRLLHWRCSILRPHYPPDTLTAADISLSPRLACFSRPSCADSVRKITISMSLWLDILRKLYG